jgi:hypothetical protein
MGDLQAELTLKISKTLDTKDEEVLSSVNVDASETLTPKAGIHTEYLHYSKLFVQSFLKIA